MMRTAAAIGAAMMMAGCTPSTNATPPADAPAPGPSGGGCTAAPLTAYVGRPFTSEVGADLQRLSGARTLRVVRPGMMVTMDFREDRLTVTLDAKGAVERVGCN